MEVSELYTHFSITMLYVAVATAASLAYSVRNNKAPCVTSTTIMHKGLRLHNHHRDSFCHPENPGERTTK